MRFLRSYWLLIVGAIVAALSTVGLVTQLGPSASFGWTAYAPLTSTTFTPDYAPFLPIIGLAVGVGLIGAGVGYLVGRRPR